MLVAEPCMTVYNPMDCALPGSSVRGILQARTLVWVDISFSMWHGRGTKMTEKSTSQRKNIRHDPVKVESQEKHEAFFQLPSSLKKKKKNPGYLNSAFYPSHAFLPFIWCYSSFFFLFLSSESILSPSPPLPYFRICLHLGSLFSLPFFNLLWSSWIPHPQRVGSRPIKFSVSAANSVPCTIRYLIALWWLWLMMFSTYTNSGEKYTFPIRWVAYKWLLWKTQLQQTILENKVFKLLLEGTHIHKINGDTTFIIFLKQRCYVNGRLGGIQQRSYRTYFFLRHVGSVISSVN